MIFNGLSGTDLIVYNALAEMLRPGQTREISAGQLAQKLNCHELTVRRSLKRLSDDFGLVNRRLAAPGLPYEYSVEDDA